jgi:signal transduction histidine kinase
MERYRQRRSKLGRKLLIAFLSLTLIPLIGISAVTTWRQYEHSRAQILNQLTSVATLKEVEAKIWFNSLSPTLELLAADPRIRSAATAPQLQTQPETAIPPQEALRNALAAGGSKFDELFLMDTTGLVKVSTNPGRRGSSYDAQPFFRQGLHAPFAQSPFYSLAYDKMVVFAAAPVRDPNGMISGVLAGVTTLDTLDEIMRERAGLGETGETYLVGADRIMLTEPRSVTARSKAFPAVLTEGATAALAGADGAGLYENYQYPPVPVVGVYRWIPELRVALLAEQNQAEAFATTFQNIWITLGVALITAIVTIGAAVAITRSIAMPLADLTSSATRVAAGDLTPMAPIQRDDEIGMLAAAFNTMTIQLHELIANLEERVSMRTAQLERSNRELRDFAMVASHDLQEPLRKIQTFGDRLQAHATMLDERGRDYLERMQRAAGRMQDLINGLLKLSRVTTRAQPFATVDLAKVAREVLSDLDVQIEQTGGRVLIGDLPTIEADSTQMRQLLQNLIGNALKFHRDAEVPVVSIDARVVSAEEARPVQDGLCDSCCRIVVEDNGIGFDERYLDRIFAPFQRLHGQNRYAGTGIGLTICQKIVERHDGTITATSVPGQGTRFIIMLPVQQRGENTLDGSP